MRHFTAIAIAASALVVVSGCDQGDKHGRASADAAAIERQIKDIEAQWAANYDKRDAAALAGHYSADAAVANPGVPLVEGAAVRPMLDQFVTDTNLDVDFASDRVQVAASGDLAYSRGQYTMRTTDPATRQPRTDRGHYLTVWKKQPDGSWKAVEDFVVPGPAPAATTEAAAQ